MDVTKRQLTRVGFWAVLVFSIFAWAPATFPGYWQSLEGFTPIFNAVHPTPIANIAIPADLWRGEGSGAFLLIRPLMFFGLDQVAAVRATFALMFILGGSSIYLWLRSRLGERSAGLAGLIYMLLPPFLATVYVRGCLSDALLWGLLPFALAGITVYVENRSLGAATVVVLAMLWMWRTQAGLAALITLFLLVYTAVVERHWVSWWIVFLSSAAGLTSLLPLWQVRAPALVTFSDHFVYLFQLFKVTWQVAPSVAGWQDAYPFQLGFAALAFSGLALWFWWMTGKQPAKSPNARLLGFSFVGAVILICLSLTFSEPLWRWSGAERLLTYPWQILLLVGPLLAVTAGSLPTLYPTFSHTPYWATLLALVILSNYSYLDTTYTQVKPPDQPLAVVGPQDNFVVLAANLVEKAQPHQATLELTWQALHPVEFDDNVFFQALTGSDASPKIVAQLDRQPLDGKRPATNWQPGEIFTDTYRLDFPSGSPQQGLRYYFGYYDWRNGARLPVDGGIDDKLVFHGQ
ncbi:MAG: hypothetical protein U0350_25595 [Caldilineaceae bacterium]